MNPTVRPYFAINNNSIKSIPNNTNGHEENFVWDPTLIDVASPATGVRNKSSKTIRIGVRNPDRAFEIATQFNDTKNSKGKLYLALLGRRAPDVISIESDRVSDIVAKISV